MLRDSFLLLFLQYSYFLLCITYGNAYDVTWYIGDGANSSADVSVCGRTPQLPCANLSVILRNSVLFEINNTLCFQSTISDNRTSTTVVFLSGTHVVPTICLFNWTNVITRGEGDVTIYSENQGDFGLFSFTNCSNITITNLNFIVDIKGRVALLFKNSSDVTVMNCSVSSAVAGSEGIRIETPFGDWLIQGCNFSGNVLQGLQDGSRGLYVIYGEGLSAVQIRDCEFTDFFISKPTRVEDLSSSRTIGQGLNLWFSDGTLGHSAMVSRCRFIKNYAYSGSTLLILFDFGTRSNNVVVDKCQFIGNHNLYGGGLAVYYWGYSSDNSASVNNSIFCDNSVDLEGGGVFAAFVSEHVSNTLAIENSLFENNSANEGAGVHLFNSPGWFTSSIEVRDELVNVKVQNSSFMNNTAYGSSVLSSASEGVINTLRIRLSLSENNTFINSVGSAVLLRASLAIISDSIRFQHNRANQGAALKILDGSRVDATGVTEARFIENIAEYSGGAIYADKESSSLSANEYSHLLAQNSPGNCFILFGNEISPTSNDTRFYFENNLAGGRGQTMDVFTLRQCRVPNFLPASVAQFAPVGMEDNVTVVYETEDDHQSTVTGPNFVFFYGASTKCYKQVADTVYLLPNCSHDLLNEMFRNHPDLQCGYERILSELPAGFGLVLHPTVDKLLAPWASLDGSWQQSPSESRQSLCNEINPGNLIISPAPGEQFDLTIQVADQLLNYISTNLYVQVSGMGDTPGVLLQLNGIQYPHTGRVYFTPNRALRGLTLVGLPGTAGELIVVTDSQITGQELVLTIPFKLSNCPVGYCPPRVSSRAEIDFLIQQNFSFTQRTLYPDYLSCDCIADGACGYRSLGYNPATRVGCVLGYTMLFGGLYWAGMIPPTREKHNTLASLSSPCNTSQSTDIYTSPTTQWVSWTLTHVHVSNRSRESSSPELLASEMGETIAANPIDVAPYLGVIIPGGGADIMCFNGYNISYLIEFQDKGEFYFDLCVGGYCRTDVLDDWILTDVRYPCNDNRQGILCGQCKLGFAVKPLTWTCSDCRGANPAWVILLTLIFGFLLVVTVVLLNLGASAPLDSLLFFLQATLILLNTRANYEKVQYLSVFTLDYSFNLCLTSDFDAFDRIFFKFATPFYVLLLLIAIILLSSVKPFSKYFGRHSYLQGIWLIMLISYVDIAEATLELLHCRTIGVQDKRKALYDDSNITCYEGKHLPAAIFATLFSTFVIVPFPIYSFLLTCWPKVKPITDVYTRVYNDNRHWWVIIVTGRRLVIVLLAVFNADYIYRHLSITILAGCLVIIDGISWPYPIQIDNYVAFICTSAFFLLCIITYPVLNRTLDPHFIISWVIISITMFCASCRLVYLHRSKIATVLEKTCTRCLRNKYFVSVKLMVNSWMSISTQDEKNASINNSIPLNESIPEATRYDQFREPLLEDSFVQITAMVRNSNNNATPSSFRVPLAN